MIDDCPQEVENPIGFKVKIASDFEGAVFQAIEVCGEYVAAKIIERDPKEGEKSLVISLNWRRHKISSVTKEYAEAIMNSKRIPTTVDEFESMGLSMFNEVQDEGQDFGDSSP